MKLYYKTIKKSMLEELRNSKIISSLTPDDIDHFWEMFYEDVDFVKEIDVYWEDVSFSAYGSNGRSRTYDKDVFIPRIQGGGTKEYTFYSIEGLDVSALMDSASKEGKSIEYYPENNHEDEMFDVYISPWIVDASCHEFEIQFHNEPLSIFEIKIKVDWNPEI